jgi:hypothetical protein
MDPEAWTQVPNAPSYLVSDRGRILSLRRRQPRLLNPRTDPKGYLVVGLTQADGSRRTSRVHVLVCEAFIGPRPDGLEVRHLDGVPANNTLGNLCYGTHAENEQDKERHGTAGRAWGARRPRTTCIRGHQFDETNTYVDSAGYRHCLACRLAARSRATAKRSLERRLARAG